MRTLLLTVALLPLPAAADTFEVQGRISAVTLYPWGASVTRRAEVSLPPGVHEVIVTNIPADTDPATLRVQPPAGATLGAVNLQSGRLPPSGLPKTPAVQAAEDAVEAAEARLAEAQAAIDAVLLKAAAAQEQVGFLRNLASSDAAAAGDPVALSRAMGAEALVALQAAHAAEAEARALEPARKDAEQALAEAQQALEALTAGLAPPAALTLSVQTSAPATAPLEITSFTPAAHWQPAYDLHLTRLTGAPALRLDRGVVIGQSSGEDWIGVDLTLSTARPSGQSQPAEVEPLLVTSAVPDDTVFSGEMARGAVIAEAAPAAAMAPKVFAEADLAMQGATVTWHYGNAVDIRSGVENLRLNLASADLTPEIVAEAVPLLDSSAYLVADTVNTTGQPLLPGPATLYADGAMIGTQSIDLTPEGEDLKLGFGPIDGLLLERVIPDKAAGERGLIARDNRQVEQALLRLRNLTTEDWPVRLVDRVPYSEQTDLSVQWTADPAPASIDDDDRRGVLVWRLDLPAGQTTEVALTTTITWPQGQVLR